MIDIVKKEVVNNKQPSKNNDNSNQKVNKPKNKKITEEEIGEESKKNVSLTKVEKSLIKKKVKPIDLGLLITIFILLALGLVIVLSASAPSALATYNDSYFFFRSQLKAAALGIVVMFILSFVDYRIYKGKIATVSIIVSIILLALVLVPGLGLTIKGSTRWLNIGFRFQPSEIMKIALILFLADRFSRDLKLNKMFIKGILPQLAVVGIIAVLLYKEPHYSALGITVMTAGIMIFVAGMKMKQILVLVPPAIIVGIYYLRQEEYRVKRLSYVFKPWEDMLDSGWQAMQSLYAIASGGLFGVGLGGSTQKYMYIPEPHNDFIFSIWAEETGFVGVMFVCILFAIFIWRGITISMKAKDMFGTLLAIGITSLIAIQVILNIAIVSATFPVTGIPLPFFSYGGTSLVITLASCGLLLNISRNGSK